MENPCAYVYIIVEKEGYGTGYGLTMALPIKKGISGHAHALDFALKAFVTF